MTEHHDHDQIAHDLVDELLRWWGTLLPVVDHCMRFLEDEFNEERGFPQALLDRLDGPIGDVAKGDPEAAAAATRLLTAAGIALSKEMVVMPFPVPVDAPMRRPNRAARRRRR